MSNDKVGYAYLEADGQVGSGAVAVYGLNLQSGAGGAGSVVLRNGTSSSGTAVMTENGTTNVAVTRAYNVGIVFPSGCFADLGTNATRLSVWYEQV